MTRQEFGAILMKAKKEANVKLIESLPYIQRLTPKRIEAIETAIQIRTGRCVFIHQYVWCHIGDAV